MRVRDAAWYLLFLPASLACGFGGRDTSSEAPASTAASAEEPPGRDPSPPPGLNKPGKNSPYAKIFVTKSGILSVNGREASLEELTSALDSLKARGGVVLYSRESPEEYEPAPVALKVLDLVMQRGLPLRLCQQTDCLDALGADGKLETND